MNKLQSQRRNSGKEFEEAIRRSWLRVPDVWRMRITDGGGASRPGDELVLTAHGNMLIEMKRTESDRFELGFLRPGQLNGLVRFDECLKQNHGLVFISFIEHKEQAFAFKITDAMEFMCLYRRKYITREEFCSGDFFSIKLPVMYDGHDKYYDLLGLVKFIPMWIKTI